jgi:hypothetical protein
MMSTFKCIYKYSSLQVQMQWLSLKHPYVLHPNTLKRAITNPAYKVTDVDVLEVIVQSIFEMHQFSLPN